MGMYRKDSNQSGFESVLLVVILAVFAIGGTGYLVYKSHHKNARTLTDTSSQTTPSKVGAQSTDTPATKTPEGIYLDLKDVGVKFLLASSVSDAVYAPYDTANPEDATVYGLSTEALEAANSANKMCTPTYGPLGIIRVTDSAPEVLVPPNGEKPATPDNKTIFKIGDRFYQYKTPQTTVCDGGTVTTDQIVSDRAAIEQSFASLVSDTAN